VLVAINVLNFYDRQVAGAIVEPVRKEFHLTDTEIGGLNFAFTMLYGLVGLPLGLLAVVSIPAAVNVGIGYATRNSPLEGFSFFTYREYVGVSSALLLFVAVCAPDVICPDRRHGTLRMYMTSNLNPTVYLAAKVAAVADWRKVRRLNFCWVMVGRILA